MDVKNECVICGVDMGPQNPRQLCRKTYCDNEEYLERAIIYIIDNMDKHDDIEKVLDKEKEDFSEFGNFKEIGMRIYEDIQSQI